jgi:hypothetical protein
MIALSSALLTRQKTKKSELKRAYQEEKAGMARSNPALQLYHPHQIKMYVLFPGYSSHS